jgi:hypothetical protein
MFKYKVTFMLEQGQPLSKEALTALAGSPYKLIIDTGYEPGIQVVLEEVDCDTFMNREHMMYLRKELFPGYDKIDCSCFYIGQNLNFSDKV